jgi:low affinity Fe/Cu permease
MRLNKLLFALADYLGRPPGFYAVIAFMALSTLLIPLGFTEVVTYLLSVAAIVITGVILIQGYRDTTAIHAKLDEIIVALRTPAMTLWVSSTRIPKKSPHR